MGRVIAAGIMGGLVMWVWGFVWNVVLPYSTAGFAHLEADQPVLGALQSAGAQDGVYFLPSHDPKGDMASPEFEAWTEKWKAGPTGFLVYRTDGGQVMSVMQLTIQLFSSILSAFLAALVLCHARNSSYGGRVMVVLLIGAICWSFIHIPFWNWFRFPTAFTVSNLGQALTTWLCAAIVMAMIVRPEARGAEA